MTSTMYRIPLRIVFYRQGDSWIAHCLELDLIGDGETREGALQELSTAISLQVAASIKLDNPANLFTPADGEYFLMFAAGKDIAKRTVELGTITREMKAASPIIEDVSTRECLNCDSKLAMA